MISIINTMLFLISIFSLIILLFIYIKKKKQDKR